MRITKARWVAAIIAAAAMSFAGIAPASAAGTTASVERIYGADRFETAVAVSKTFAPGVDVVYIAVGGNFPDALAAAPAATLLGGPLLLTQQKVLPGVVSKEIERLSPGKIVVVGGTGAVSETVYRTLSGLAPEIQRVAGADRYETGRAIVQNAFSSGVTSAYIATGANFPDALSAAAAAGSRGVPVILVPGSNSAIDGATAKLIRDLGITSVKIVGGTATISAGTEASLSKLPGIQSVQRFAGKDRYETSRLVNADAFPTMTKTFVAVGSNFPDALAGAARAGFEKTPLIVVPGNCIPQPTLDLMNSRQLSTLTLLGGPSSLGGGVNASVACFNPAPVNGNGSYRVGSEIPAGTYWSAASEGCYWERLSSFDGSFDSIIANSYGSGAQIVTIDSGDVGFESSGCGTWRGLQNAPWLGKIPGDAVVAVNLQVSPGTYRNDNRDGGCYWARLNSFTGDFDDIEANEYATVGTTTVTISSSDTGFESSGCGTWTRLG